MLILTNHHVEPSDKLTQDMSIIRYFWEM